MQIKNFKPYFIKRVDNEKEFVALQKDLFSKGYKWLGDSGEIIWIDKHFVKYPIFVSNLDFIDNYCLLELRKESNEFSNNIFFLSERFEEFNMKKLRYEKIIKLNEI